MLINMPTRGNEILPAKAQQFREIAARLKIDPGQLLDLARHEAQDECLVSIDHLPAAAAAGLRRALFAIERRRINPMLLRERDALAAMKG